MTTKPKPASQISLVYLAILSAALVSCSQPVSGVPSANKDFTSATWSADASSPPLQPTDAPHPDGRVIAVPFSAACPLFGADEMGRLIDTAKPIDAEEQPRKEKGAVTNMCRYSQEDAGGSFGAISVVFYPGDGYRIDVGMREVVKNKTNVSRIDRNGDLVAVYQHESSATKRGMVIVRKVGPDAVLFLLDVDSSAPDLVTGRLHTVANTILSRLPQS